jgi:hypothetical protein
MALDHDAFGISRTFSSRRRAIATGEIPIPPINPLFRSGFEMF